MEGGTGRLKELVKRGGFLPAPLAERIRQARPKAGELALFSLAQAGFCLKTSAGTTLVIDPYLSDCVERMAGFRRLIRAPIAAGDLRADLVACTHGHPDHFDPDTIPLFARNPETRFVGAADCAAGFREAGLGSERVALLRPGETFVLRDVSLRATGADHGALAPEAIGFLVQTEGMTVYNVGDSGPAFELFRASLNGRVDILICPINGAFGNLDESEACRLAQDLSPRLVIGCHFGMFAEHGGDPSRFLALATALPPEIEAWVMAPGEGLVLSAARERWREA